MTEHLSQIDDRRNRFRIVSGTGGEGAFRAARRAKAARPCHDAVGPSELAAELALIHALSLIRDVPLDDLDNPHHSVRLSAHAGFTLHELLCELRSLPWFDRHAEPSFASNPSAEAWNVARDAERLRRASRWNDDGQLTLRMLLRGVTAADGRGPLVSQLLPTLDHVRPTAVGSPLDDAFETMPMSDAPALAWQNWLEANRSSSRAPLGQLPQNLCELAALGHSASAGRVSLGLALSIATAELQPVPALARRSWGGAELMPLMAQAVSMALQAGHAQAAVADRMRRPAVLAARISLMTGRDCEPANPAEASAGQVLGELRRFAPRLLGWVAQRNAADAIGAAQADPRLAPEMCMRDNLMLPAISDGDVPLHQSDVQSQGTIIGACMTLLKAVYAGPFSGVTAVAPTASVPGYARSLKHQLPCRPGLSADLDKLASNLVLGRLVAGSYFHFENLAALRKGERIAVALLSELAESDHAQGDLGFVSFDGHCVRISAGQHADGSVRAKVLKDGSPLHDLGGISSQGPAVRAV